MTTEQHLRIRKTLAQKLKAVREGLSLSRGKLSIDALTADLLYRIKDFLHLNISLFETSITAQLSSKTDQISELKLLETHIDNSIVFESALSSDPSPGANIALLQQLTLKFETFSTLGDTVENPEIVTSLQNLLWEIIQHISKLIREGRLTP